MGPTCSVIIPAYNAAATIDRAVRSVLDQTFQDFEIVVADDCSTDDTYDRLLAWAERDERVRPVRLSSNSGEAAGPRNAAITASRGDYLAFLDADDRWLPSKLDRQLELHRDGGYALTYTRCLVDSIDPLLDGRDYHEAWGGGPITDPSLEDLVRANVVPVLTAVVGRRWQERVGLFVPGLNEDWHYWVRVAAHGGRIGFCDEPLAVYTWAPSGISHDARWDSNRRTSETLRALAVEFPDRRALFLGEDRRRRRILRRARARSVMRRAARLLGREQSPFRLDNQPNDKPL